VQTKVLSEQEAEELEHEPDKVDLVIRFKDVESILGLIGGANVDIVGMLLDNVVQLKGNVGHLFKLGAIGANIQQAIQPDDLKIH
jgi:negative regulator of genetic competence, sporulation and motility